MSQKLALFPLTLADHADTAAHGVILLLVLLIGFAVAWLVQTVRRQRAVRQLIERQLEDERAQIEESRLLAEDMLQEQATLIAQQDRRIEHLKGRLARQIALQQAGPSSPPTSGPAASGKAAPPPAAAPMATATASRSPGAPDSSLVAHTIAMASQAATLRRVRLSACLPQGSPSLQLQQPGGMATGVPVPTRTLPDHARPDQLHTPQRHDSGLEWQALRRQLRLERAVSHEKARLMRHYERDAAQWQQALRRSEARRASLQLSVDTLEKLLQESRELRANAECELQRLREQLQQQQALSMMDSADLARKATSFRLRDTVHYLDDPGTLIPNTQVRYPHLGHNRPPVSGGHGGGPRRPS